MSAGMDWHEWHRAYDDPNSPLSERLAIVQGLIRQVIDGAPTRSLSVISMCCGEARDLGGFGELHGRAVELDPELATRATANLPPTIEVVVGDAGISDAYEGATPADLVLVCGVFGNVSDDDIRHTIDCLPMLCARDSYVIWTRHRRQPDATTWIRSYFADHDFDEIAFAAPDNQFVGVGMQRFTGEPQPFRPHVRLFDFVGEQNRALLCPECGFSYAMGRSEILPWIRHDVAAFVETFQSYDAADASRRPGSDVWSPLEYACHVRDVLTIQRERIIQTQHEDEPAFAPMRRDERAVEQRYNEQDPVAVAAEITDAGNALRELLASLDDADWIRTGIYNFPAPQPRTVEWIAIHTAHELLHHRIDIGTRA